MGIAIKAIGTGINGLWTAYDYYTYYQLGKFAYNVYKAVNNAPKEVDNIENIISSIESTDEIVSEAEANFVQKENLSFEGYIKEIENILYSDILMKSPEAREAQEKNLRESMVERMKEIIPLSPDLQAFNASLTTGSLVETLVKYKDKIKAEDKIFSEMELSFMLGSPDGSRMLNLMEIWKRIIQFIKNNIWTSIYSEKLFASLQEKLNDIIQSKTIKNHVDLVSRTGLNFYSKFMSKKVVVSAALFESFLENNEITRAPITLKVGEKHTIKGENKLSEQEIYSLAKNIMLNPLVSFSPYAEAKTKERDVQTTKTSILNDLRAVLI